MKNRVGEKFKTTKGELFTIVEYFSTYNCTIQFEDGTILKNKTYSAIKTNEIYNPNLPHIYGKFFVGEGRHKPTLNSKGTKLFNVWYRMASRCNDLGALNRNPTYIGITVCEKWHNFQNFGDWFEENYEPKIMQGWHLDKDILFKGNKVYSPKTCCFVPQEINIIFTRRNKKKSELPQGVSPNGLRFRSRIRIENKEVNLGTFDTIEEAFQAYKTAKEKHIKEVAEVWKPLITPEVYNAMYNYIVEITD